MDLTILTSQILLKILLLLMMMTRRNYKVQHMNIGSLFFFIKHADVRRYGSLIDDLQASFAHEHNEYPKTLEKAIDLLDSQKFDSCIKVNADASDKDRSKSK